MFVGSFLSGVADTTPPAKIAYFVTAFPTSKTITLVWRSVGDDGNSGTATKYDIRYSLSPIATESAWNSATKVKCDITPSPAGSAESFMISGLSPLKKYYFAIKSGDEVPNWSPLSKSPSGTTPAITDTIPPGKIIDLTTSDPSANSITLTWTAPGDNGKKTIDDMWIQPKVKYSATGLASRYIPYDIRYSLKPITDANWDSATKVQRTPIAQELSKQEKFAVAGLLPSTKYYFAIKTADDVPNWSGVSNCPSETTRATGINTPYKGVPSQIPGKIEIEDFDNGGQSVAYYDTTPGNSGKQNQCRTNERVDIGICNDTAGGYYIGWVDAGEWLKYTVNVKTAGTYTIEIRVACLGSGGTFHIEFDDIDKTGPMLVPDTAGWASWQTITKTGVILTAGKHVMKLAMDSIGSNSTGNFNYINIIPEAQQKPNITANAMTTNSTNQPNDKLLFHEGVLFPDPNLAPIKTPYLISWRAGPGEQPHETENTFGYTPSIRPRHDEMVAKGKLPIPWSGAAHDDPSKSANPNYLDTEEKMYDRYLKIAEEGYFGIEIDEYSSYDTDNRVQESLSALRRVKKQYPSMIMAAGIAGAAIDKPISDGADVINLYEPEIYIYPGTRYYKTFIKRCTDSVKYYGLEAKTIGIFSGGDAYKGNPADVDLWIKYLRAESPKMASIGIGIYKLYNSSTEERAVFDKVMDDDFFKLSPTVSITAPANNTKLSGTVKITVIAKKNFETDNPVVSYRYFIDNKLIKISSSPEYQWNTAGYPKGKHIITVHAVADDYLAGVSQVNVTTK